MFYTLMQPYWQDSVFNLFRYITFRTVMGATTGFIVAWAICGPLIKYLKRKKYESQIREDTPERHQLKKGTPTMGGLVIIAGVLAGTLLWARLSNTYVLLSLVSLVLTGAIGCLDDYLKDIRKKPKGLLAKYKLYGQIAIGLAVSIMIYLNPPLDVLRSATELPFIKNVYLPMGIGYILFTTLVIVGSSNGVNLSDGLDGLAAGLVGILAATLTVVAYVSGRADFTNYLNITYLPGSEELSIFLASIVGSLLGFLWFNSYPAQIFMGDTGALSLGTSMAVASIILKKELLLFIAGGVFVLETLSVMMQVSYFKLSGGKRIFKMAPLHHHFELSGWHESKITVRFWILGIIFALLGLVSFKIR